MIHQIYGSLEYQKQAWESLKKRLVRLVNEVNVSNIKDTVQELFGENIIRGWGVLAKAIMEAQATSQMFTNVYAALVSAINSKIPQIGLLLLTHLVVQFKTGFQRNDKASCESALKFIASLVTRQVAFEIIVLEILDLLMANPSNDSVEMGIDLLKECGAKLENLSPESMHAIYEKLHTILQEQSVDLRTQCMIEEITAIRQDKYKGYPSVPQELDLGEGNATYLHLITLEEAKDGEDILNDFKFDPDYQLNEERCKDILKKLLRSDESDESDSTCSCYSDSECSDDEAGGRDNCDENISKKGSDDEAEGGEDNIRL